MSKLFNWKLKKELLDKGYFKYILISLTILSAIGISYVFLNYKKSIYRFEQPRVNIINNVFASNQSPVIDISTYYDTTTLGKVLGVSDPPNIPIIKKLIDSQGDRVENASLEAQSDGKYKLVLPENKGIKPGKYVVEIEYGAKSFTSEFYWGVLSINTHKSVYELNEEAKIYLGALNKDGHTLCDANLILTILTPTAKVLTPKVTKSGKCFGDNVTTVPDYSSKLEVSETGEYKMILKNSDTGYQIEDTFDVVESVDFSIERKGPTRIYPYVSYPMSIIVTSKKDFKGTLVEKVPISFKIKGYTKIENGKQLIELDADLKAGASKTFEYFFDAPDISPEYYSLGPLQIGEFIETREWQIASDADGSGTNTVNPTAVNQASTGNTLTFTFTAAETMDSGEVAIKVPTSEGWSTPQSSAGTKGYTTASFSGSGGLADELYQFEGGSWKSDDNDSCNVAVDGALGLAPDTSIVYEGDASVTCNNTANTGPDGTDSFGVDWSTAQDWSSISAVTFQFRVSVDTTANILQAAIDDNVGCDSPIEEYNMPAITAGSWTQVTWTFSGAGSTRTGVRTFCINANSTGLDSRQVWLDDLRISGGAQISDADTVVDADDNDTCNVATSGELGIVMDTTTVKQGNASITCNNTGNTAADASDSFGIRFAPDANWQNYTKVGYWVRSSTNTASTDIDIAIDDNYGCTSPIEEGDVPALTANTWTYATWAFSGAGSTRTAVRTLCWNAAVAGGLDSKQIWVDEVLIGPGTLKYEANGSDVDIRARLFSMANAEVLTITYGSGGGTSGADAPTSTGTSTFTTRTRIDSGGALTSISSSPTVTINSSSITISGVIKQTDESSAYNCSTNNITVHASINGGTNTSTTCTESSGAFSITVGPPASGNPVVVYIDSAESISATTVTLASTGNITNLDMYVDRLILTHENAGPITNANLATGDNGNAGIRYAVSSGNLTTESNIEIHVKSGKTYDPGGTVTTQGSGGLHLDDGPSTTAYLDTASNTIAGDITVDANATLYTDTTTSVGGGDITVNGTLTYSTGTPTTTLTSTGTIGGSGTITFYTLSIGNSAITSIASSINVNSGNLTTTGTGSIGYSGTPTVTLTGAGTLGGGTGTITFYDLVLSGASQTTTLSTNGLVISNSLNIGSSHVFAMGTNSVTLGSTSIADSGDLTISSGASTSQSSGTFTVLGNTTSPDWSGPGTLTVYNLTIGNGTNSILLDNETADVAFDINNDFTITASSTYQASSTASLKVGGSYANSGTFTANQSVMEFDAGDSGNTLSGTMTGGSAFYELKFNNASGSWSINNNVVTHNFNLSDATNVTAPASLTVSGFFNGGGVFSHNNGLVTLNGVSGETQSIISTTAFYDLTATASGNRIITFSNGSENRVINNLTLTGTSCDALLLLRGDNLGNTWSLDDDIGGTTTVSYVDVQDSNAIDQAISASNSVNSGGNTNWTISASACEGASTSTTPTSYSFQRKTLFDETNDIYWLAYHDGDEIEFKYSSDVGSNWNAASNGHIPYDTNDFSLWRATISSTEYVFLIVKDGYDIKLRVGTLSSNNITWDNDIDTVFDGTGASDSYAYPYVALDSSNYIWIGARYYDGTNYVYKVVDSTSTGNTDLSTLSWNTSKQISDNQTNSNVYGNIVPLGSQDMYATFAVGTTLKGCMWDESANSWIDSSNASCENVGTTGIGESQYFNSLSDNLVGYWKMNETSWNGTTGEVLDETANNLDGVRNGDATTASVGYNRAGSFDGSGDYVSVSDPGTSPLDITGELTLSAWIYKNADTPTNGWDDIVTKASTDAQTANYWMQIIDIGGSEYLDFFFYNGNYHEIRSDNTVPSNEWVHVAVTYNDTNNTIQFFINGVKSDATVYTGSPLTSSLLTNNEPLRIGNTYSYQDFPGYIDEVRIYDAELGIEDIKKLTSNRPDKIMISDSTNLGSISGQGQKILRNSDGEYYIVAVNSTNLEVWHSVDGINWSEQDSSNSPSCSTSCGQVAIGLTSTNVIDITFVEITDSGTLTYDLEHITFNTNTDTFGTQTNLRNPASDTITELSGSMDASNKYHISWSEGSNIYYSNNVGGTFKTPVTVEAVGITAIDMTIDIDGKPQIAYINTTDDDLTVVRGNQNDTTSFSTDIFDVDTSINDTTNQRGVSIAVDTSTGNTWVTYIDSTGYVSLAKHIKDDSWSTWTVENTKSDTGYEPSIAITGKSEIYVFYQEDSTDQKIVYDIYYSRATSPSWKGETILETPVSGVDYSDINVKWSFEWNHLGGNTIEYIFSDETDLYLNKLSIRKEPVKFNEYGNMLHSFAGRNLFRTSTGILYAFFLDESPVSGNYVEIWKSLDNGNTWIEGDAAGTDTVYMVGYIPHAAAIDSNDVIHILYHEENDGPTAHSLRYNTYTTSTDTFGTPTLIESNSSSSPVYYAGSIAIDSNDETHIIYSSDNNIIYRNSITGSPITIKTVPSRNWDIAINEDNIPEISFIDTTNSDLYIGLGNANDATAFSIYPIDTSVNITGDVTSSSLAIDSVGNTYCGYINSDNTVSMAKYSDNSGKSLDFDGSTDYVNVPYNAGFDLTTDITVMFWFKPDVTIDSGISTNMGIMSKAYSNSDANNDWVFFWNSGQAGALRFGTYGDFVYTTNSTWNANTWYHVAATVTSTNTAYIYVNGVQDNAGGDSSVASSPINGDQNTPLQIGYSRISTGDHYFDGQIDDVRIYNTALSQAQIQATMFSDIAGNESNLVAAWEMDEGSGQDVFDSTSGNYDGTLGASSASASDDPTWYSQTPIGWSIIDSKADTGALVHLAAYNQNIYSLYVDDQDNLVYDTYTGGNWAGEVLLEELTSITKSQIKWSLHNNNGSDGVDYGGATTSSPEIDYMFYDGTDLFYNRLLTGGTAATQDTIDTIPSNLSDNFSTVVDSSNNVHIAFIDDSTTDQVSYKKWTNSTKTWSSATLIPSSASDTHTNVSLAINKSSGDLDDLYTSWIDTSNNHIYYRQYDASGTSWQTVQDWKTTGTNLNQSLNYGNDGRIFALWTQGSSAPTTADWGSIKSPAGGNSPTVTSVSLNGGSTITLTEGTTTTVSWTATVTDADGNANISSATGKAYRSGVANAQNCTTNDANCYTVASCNLSNCSGNSCTATCTANFQFFTDATDTGSTYDAQYWRAWIQATDANSNTGEGFSAANAPDVASTAGLEITSSITYGALLAGDDTGSSPKTTTVTNTGNTTLDLEVSGTSLCTNYPTCSGPTIAVGYQEYHTNTFTYGAGTGLTLSPSSVQFDLNKATQNPSNSTATMYWGLGVPNPKEDGSYTGANTVSAVNGGS